MVFKMVIGKRYSEVEASHGKDDNDRCRNAVRNFLELTGTFTVRDSLPFLRWLDLGGHEKAMKKTAKELDQILEKWLEEHKQKRNSGNVEMGVYRALVVNNWETAKECLTTNDKAFASRPKTLAMEFLSFEHTMVGFTLMDRTGAKCVKSPLLRSSRATASIGSNMSDNLR
ncbi:hypothetical protein QQP08_023293 [Theobroma cacao]|nr:hypothetical protein QQP08_023293 [Theobroma cacao]